MGRTLLANGSILEGERDGPWSRYVTGCVLVEMAREEVYKASAMMVGSVVTAVGWTIVAVNRFRRYLLEVKRC